MRALISSSRCTLRKMEITKDVLLELRQKLEAEIAQAQQDITAKDGALQMIEGLLAHLEKEPPKEEIKK